MTWVDFKKGSKLTWTNFGSAKFPVTCSQCQQTACTDIKSVTAEEQHVLLPPWANALPPRQEFAQIQTSAPLGSPPSPSSSNTRNQPHPPLRIDNTPLPLREWKQWALGSNNSHLSVKRLKIMSGLLRKIILSFLIKMSAKVFNLKGKLPAQYESTDKQEVYEGLRAAIYWR